MNIPCESLVAYGWCLEETVLEIKRQSIIDLQKAVSQTEQKSNEILLREREQYQRIKAQTFEEAYTLFNRQEDGPEVRTQLSLSGILSIDRSSSSELLALRTKSDRNMFRM